MIDRPASIHVGVTVECCEQVEPALDEACRVAPGRALCLTIVGLPPSPPAFWYLAALGGALPIAPALLSTDADAARAARLAARQAPLAANVTHRCAAGWRAPWLLDELRRGLLEVLVLAAEPRCRRDRRALEGAARAGAVSVVTLR